MSNQIYYNLLNLKHKLRPRQEEALPLIKNNDDFIVVLPTGYGKTLIAEIAMAKALSEKTKVILLSPLKVLTQEQTTELKQLFPNSRVIIDDGDNRKNAAGYGLMGGINKVSEKALIRYIIDHSNKRDKTSKKKSELKTMTKNELIKEYFVQYVIFNFDKEDPYTKKVFELRKMTKFELKTYIEWDIVVLTYHRYNSKLNKPKQARVFKNVGLIVIDEVHDFGNKSSGSVLETAMVKTRIIFPKVRFIGLSATIDNAEEFTNKLNTKLILAKKSERPVPLQKKIVAYRNNWSYSMNLAVRIDMVKEIMRRHPKENFLIFTTSRNRTKEVAAGLMGVKTVNLNSLGALERSLYNHQIGWHNAGMKKSDRRLVERLFREQKIKVICTTPTLAKGVNLPAGVVIIFDMYQYSFLSGRSIIEKDRLEQTIGRAGRPGLSEFGFAYILCQEDERTEVAAHIKTPLRVVSQLRFKFKQFLLEIITAEIYDSLLKTKYIIQQVMDKKFITESFIYETLDWLKSHGFIKVIKDKLLPTYRGRMTTYQCILPETIVHWNKVLRDNKNLNSSELFCLLASAPEYALMVAPYKSDAKKIELANIYTNLNDNILNEFYLKYKGETVDLTDHIYKIFALTFNKELMMKYKVDANTFSMSYGDKYAITEASTRYLIAAKTIFGNECGDIIDSLVIGSKHSILTGDLIELSKVKGIGEIRLNKLMREGIDSIEKLISTSSTKIGKILRLKPEHVNTMKIGLASFL